MNAISLGRLALVHPVLSSRVVSLFSLLGFDCEVSQGLRTWAQQDALCAQIPKVTEVCGGYSAHNFGYAVDVVPEDVTPGQPDWNINSPAWKKILAVAPSCGLAEGALWRTFPDSPHIFLQELPATPTDEMREIFQQGGLPAIFTMINAAISVQ